MIFMDTDAIIDILRGNPKIAAYIFAHPNQVYAIPTPVLYEIYYGFFYPPLSKRFQNDEKFIERIHKEEQVMVQFINGAKTFDLNLSAVKKAAEVSALLDSKGLHIGIMDSLIAGITLSNGFYELLSKNKTHYENIPNLIVHDYTEA